MMTHLVRFCVARVHGLLPHEGPCRPKGRMFFQLHDRARAAIRLGRIDLAEAFVMEDGDSIWASAPSLNLLGLIAESRGQWRRARRMWSRAARTDPHYAPAYQNLRRYFELFQFGRTGISVAFGDEPQFQLAGQEARS